MIRELSNGIKVIELGLGTTHISQVIHKDDTISSGICFSNTIPDKNNIQGDEIIIEINGYKGILAYLMPIIQLIKSYGSDSESIANILHELDNFIKLELKQ